MRRLTEDVQRRNELIRAALGPYEDMKRLVAAQAPFAEALSKAAAAASAYLDHFRRPAYAEIEALSKQMRALDRALPRLDRYDDALRHAMESMRSPWVDTQNKLQSIRGFAGLQAIGLRLNHSPAFDASVAKALRNALGDWRTAMTFPPSLADDVAGRTAFYAERGLNPELTAFPADAFKESLSVAGLRRPPPPLVGLYAGDTEEDDPAGFERTNEAHRRLLRFETQLRKFIDARMRAAYGENWIKQRVPGDMRLEWKKRKESALANGEPSRPLIAYADFTDYVKVITRSDNWREVFRPVFRSTDAVRESFQRLYPIRLCVMHARLITQDDELYLHVETMRLLKAIGTLYEAG